MMPSILIVLSVSVVGVFIGNLIGKLVPLLNRVALPGAVLGGLLFLGLGPQLVDPVAWPGLPEGALEEGYQQLATLPGLFINIVFACLMLGRRFRSMGFTWRRARPLIVMGHVYAWGQYVVGLLVVAALLEPLFGIDPLAGTLIAIGFQGGHGTAAGLSENFDQLGFPEGEAIAMALATLGVFLGVVGGPFIASHLAQSESLGAEDDEHEAAEHDDEPDIPQALEPNPLTGRLTVHLALVALTIGLGLAALTGLQELERWLRPADTEMLWTGFMPLFSVVLMAGLGLQLVLQALGWDVLFDRALFERISSFALDVVIFGALATLPLAVIGEHWIAIGLLGLLGVAWNLGVLLWAGPKVYRSPWYAYGVGDFGGGTATTACGLMLVHVADPDRQTPALDAYADKQPFYEPIMGGGLVTALALPVVAGLGAWGALALTSAVLLAWGALARWTARGS